MMSRIHGRRLSQREHIAQSIADILTTPVGTRVMRRDYGSLLPELIDQPLNDAGMLRVNAAAADALIRQEPRITLQRVNLARTENGLVVDVEASETDGSTSNLIVTIGLKGVSA